MNRLRELRSEREALEDAVNWVRSDDDGNDSFGLIALTESKLAEWDADNAKELAALERAERDDRTFAED